MKKFLYAATILLLVGTVGVTAFATPAVNAGFCTRGKLCEDTRCALWSAPL